MAVCLKGRMKPVTLWLNNAGTGLLLSGGYGERLMLLRTYRTQKYG